MRVFAPGAVVTIDEYSPTDPTRSALIAIDRSISAFWPVEVDRSSGRIRVATASALDRDRVGRPGDAPDPPEGCRIGERVAVHEDEVRGPAVAQVAGIGLAEELAAAPRGGAERLPRLQPGVDEPLDLPGELVGPERAAAEVGAGRDPDAGAVGGPNRRLRVLAAGRQGGTPLGAREPLDRRGLAE